MISRTLVCLALAAAVSAGGLAKRQDDPQKSRTLLEDQVQDGLFNNNDGDTEAGQVDSATSSNNFINFCKIKNLPLTNGAQVKTGSCNPTVMGVILATDRLPGCKFTQPDNFGVVKANTNFTIALKVENMSMGFFVNPNKKYFAAPSDTNDDGFLKAHSHVTCNAINGLDDKGVAAPLGFAFFKGLNGKLNDKGELTTVVAGGLKAGDYRCCSINTAANHQPVLGSVAQHTSFDDCIYFSATDSGNDEDDEEPAQAPAPAPANNGKGKGGNGNGQGQNGGGQKGGNGQQGQTGGRNNNAGSSNSNGNGSNSNSGASSGNNGKASQKEQDPAKCRVKRLRRRAAHQKRAAELERERRQRRA